jgi:hypothetical protein
MKINYLLLIFINNIIYINCDVSLYGQCGGQGYTGSTTCAPGSTCYAQSIYYSQCLTSCPGGWVCIGNKKNEVHIACLKY